MASHTPEAIYALLTVGHEEAVQPHGEAAVPGQPGERGIAPGRIDLDQWRRLTRPAKPDPELKPAQYI
ncbi:MAG: hypothetical protein JJE13_03225 [Thermoleophilia bacterium]|nr:hypothetical protein [Thermoleophilia bacterium]